MFYVVLLRSSAAVVYKLTFYIKVTRGQQRTWYAASPAASARTGSRCYIGSNVAPYGMWSEADMFYFGIPPTFFYFLLFVSTFSWKKTKKTLEVSCPCLHRVRRGEGWLRETGWWEGCRDGGLVIRKLECGSRCVMWLLAGPCQPTSSSSSSTNNQEQACTTEEGRAARMDMFISMIVIWFRNSSCETSRP